MSQTITPGRLSLLQLIAKHPDVSREQLLAIKGITEADLAYLEGHDLARQREAGRYRVSHLGEMALKRSL
ncbi:MAG TPA: hypothetical protein VJ570_08645 [Holophagaceae bacterium]|nr:hypothetical protein [Holophagaceae bacterium]